MLRIEDLTKTFGPVTVLQGVTESFQAGSVHALVGANGAGKSTLIKILSGLQRSTSGRMILDGTEVVFSSPEESYLAGIRTLQQETDINLFTSLSVIENTALRTRQRHGLGRLVRPEDLRQARERLALVGADDVSLNAIVGDLPLAKRQQVALASALDADARVLILDEPTAALDRSDAHRLLDVIRSIRNHGAAVIFVSHHLTEIVELADRVTILREGRTVDRFEMPADRNQAVILPRIIANMTGQTTSATRERRSETKKPRTVPANRLLQVESLWAQSVRDVSFAVDAGEVVSLTGLVGSGNSAVLQCIYGLRTVARGRLALNGKTVPWSGPDRMARLGMGLVPDDRQHMGLHLQHDIVWNCTLPTLKMFTGPAGYLAHARLDRATQEVAAEVGLVASRLSLPTAALSGGNQQKVVIAKWLTSPRKILLLDEPTRGVDVSTRHQIYRLLRNLARDEGLGVLCSTYDFDEAIHLSDRILTMRRGEIVAETQAEDATEERLMDLAMGGVQ